MNAPARVPQGSARITFRGRDQFVARMPRHRSAVWRRPSTLERIKMALLGGPLSPLKLALLVLLAPPLGLSLLLLLLMVTP